MKRSILFALLLSVVLFSACGTNEFEREVRTEDTAVKLAREVMRGGYDVITTSELAEAMATGGDMLVVDAMPLADSYDKEHVPGAVQFLFPVEEMEEWDPEAAGGTQGDYEALLGPDKNRLIVVYCGFTRCGRSHNAAAWATRLGYTNVRRYPGGIFAWKGAGNPVESAD